MGMYLNLTIRTIAGFWQRQRELITTVHIPGLTPLQPGSAASPRGSVSGAAASTARSAKTASRVRRHEVNKRRKQRKREDTDLPDPQARSIPMISSSKTASYGRLTFAPGGDISPSEPHGQARRNIQSTAAQLPRTARNQGMRNGDTSPGLHSPFSREVEDSENRTQTFSELFGSDSR